MPRGRKSAAAQAVAPPVKPLHARLAPPAGLTDEQRKLWTETVNARPAEWFGPEHVPLLTLYIRHVATADALSREIDKFDPATADVARTQQVERFTRMRNREAAAAKSFARVMRLTQLSIYRAEKAATLTKQPPAVTKRKPWELAH